jgi:hypothetical protein
MSAGLSLGGLDMVWAGLTRCLSNHGRAELAWVGHGLGWPWALLAMGLTDHVLLCPFTCLGCPWGILAVVWLCAGLTIVCAGHGWAGTGRPCVGLAWPWD